MKSAVWVSLLAIVFAILFPYFMGRSAAAEQENPVQEEEPVSTQITQAEEPQAVTALPQADTPLLDAVSTVLVQDGETVRQMSMKDYLIGVVSAEMPASFEPEALKAQAVAARTYTRYIMTFCPEKHENADICTDPGCCKAFSDEKSLQEKWGSNYSGYHSKIVSCVNETDGETLVYEGAPILAVFHSSSAGHTEDSGKVWQSSLPYLQSVKSPETSEEVPDYVTTVRISQEEFRSVMQGKYPECDLSGDASAWFGAPEKTPSGRLQNIPIGGVSVSGTELRAMFSLRSAAITVTSENGEILFTVTGYGHGVGMSQYGANELAKEGFSYEEILMWYYTGAVLSADA